MSNASDTVTPPEGPPRADAHEPLPNESTGVDRGRALRDRLPAGREGALFLLRTAALYYLVLHAALQLDHYLSLLFVSIAFALSLAYGVWFHATRLRVLPAILLFSAVPWVFRAALFLLFQVEQGPAPAPAADNLFAWFDRNYFPALVPVYVGFLFTFLSLRSRRFAVVEVCVNAVILVAVFAAEGGRPSLYPHPSVFAVSVAAFIVAESLVLFLVRYGERPTRSTAAAFLPFLGVAMPLALLVLLFLLGRYSEGSLSQGGGLIRPTLFRFDFSDYIRLESEISSSDDLVLLYRKEGPAERTLLRRHVLAGYDQRRGFYQDPGTRGDGSATTVPDHPLELPDPGYAGRFPVEQEYFLVNFDPSALLALNYPVRVTPLRTWDDSSFVRIYRVVSQATDFIPMELSFAAPPALPEDEDAYYTQHGDNEAIARLAEEITADVEGYYDKALAIEFYLKENFLYSLKPGVAADGDQLGHFLFESKKGYCSYFAFAMALMCRSLDIPARVAVGFFVNPQMEVLNFYPVHANQAHAWVEVYFDDYGWVEFDPTSETPAPGEEVIFGGVEPDRLAGLIGEILDRQSELEPESGDAGPDEPAGGGSLRWLRGGVSFIARYWFVVIPAVYLVAIAAIKLGPALSLALSTNPRRAVKGRFALSLLVPYGLGLHRRERESWLGYADRLDALGLDAGEWTQSYLRAVFAPRFGPEDLAVSQARQRAFRASLRRTTPLLLRVAAFLNPVGSLRRRR